MSRPRCGAPCSRSPCSTRATSPTSRWSRAACSGAADAPPRSSPGTSCCWPAATRTTRPVSPYADAASPAGCASACCSHDLLDGEHVTDRAAAAVAVVVARAPARSAPRPRAAPRPRLDAPHDPRRGARPRPRAARHRRRRPRRPRGRGHPPGGHARGRRPRCPGRGRARRPLPAGHGRARRPALRPRRLVRAATARGRRRRDAARLADLPARAARRSGHALGGRPGAHPRLARPGPPRPGVRDLRGCSSPTPTSAASAVRCS